MSKDVEVYLKAKKILDERKESLDRFNLILSAGLCPICGKSLILKTKKWTTKEKRGIFRKEVDVLHKQNYFACPDGHPLINPEGNDRSNPGCYEYNGLENPNRVIYDYWFKHSPNDFDSDFDNI